MLATFVIDDFGISRGQFGLMSAATSAVSVVASPLMGPFTDRIGGKRSLIGVFVLSTLGICGIALAPDFAIVLLVALVTGFGVAWASPATNRLLTDHIPAGRRGVITGVKQSGEMVAFVLSGALLPAAALLVGWRPAFGLVALWPLLSIIWASITLTRDATGSHSEQHHSLPRPRVQKDVWWLSGYSLLMGMGCGSIVAYLALYSHEGVGLSVTTSGLVVLTGALVAIVFRILWSFLTERASAYRRSFQVMSLLAAFSVVVLWSASVLWKGFIWLGAVGFGATGLSFAALGMLAAMAASSDATTGRDTGLVNLGFSAGITIGPPLFGLAADLTGAYTVSLLGSATALVAAALVVHVWRWRAKNRF